MATDPADPNHPTQIEKNRTRLAENLGRMLGFECAWCGQVFAVADPDGDTYAPLIAEEARRFRWVILDGSVSCELCCEDGAAG